MFSVQNETSINCYGWFYMEIQMIKNLGEIYVQAKYMQSLIYVQRLDIRNTNANIKSDTLWLSLHETCGKGILTISWKLRTPVRVRILNH